MFTGATASESVRWGEWIFIGSSGEEGRGGDGDGDGFMRRESGAGGVSEGTGGREGTTRGYPTAYEDGDGGGREASRRRRREEQQGRGQQQIQQPREVELLIRKWDPEKEECVPVTDIEEVLRWRANLGSVWKEGLMPYRQSAKPLGAAPLAAAREHLNYNAKSNNNSNGTYEQSPEYHQQHTKFNEDPASDWPHLTSHTTPSILSRLTNRPGLARSATGPWTLTSTSCSAQDRDDIPGLNSADLEEAYGAERELVFLGIDLSRTWREGAVGRERTEGVLDRSWALGEVVRRCEEDMQEVERDGRDLSTIGEGKLRRKKNFSWGSPILGSLQICFLMVLTLGNYSCLEEWKRILGLVFTCKKLVKEREPFFVDVVTLLARQLRRCAEDVEGGLFDMAEEVTTTSTAGAAATGGAGGYLKSLLKTFKRSLDEVFPDEDYDDDDDDDDDENEGGDNDNHDGRAIKEAVADLEAWLKAEYNWDLSDSYVRRGMLELEDGERVEMEMDELEGEDERGEYAPVVVELG